MSAALQLIRAILAERCPDDASARRVLEEALLREVDPLRYCAATLGLGEALVMERAARWADLAYYDVIPSHLDREIAPNRLEAIAEVRVFTLTVIDRPVAFAAPDFAGLVSLRQRRMAEPALRGRICLVPESALRDYLARTAAQALLVGARQNLSKRWPFATAQLELTNAARYGFVAGLVLLIVMVLVAPYLAQFWLLPIALCVLIGPSLIRLAALFTPRREEPPPEHPDDAELPLYSVLIPLRDETAMVPQLFAAMRAIDYPPERLDIKFVVETRSPETIAAVEQHLGDPRFSIIRVLDAMPRTKPKALDYALPLCRGEFVVVFDAEDIPDPDQLWKAALRFRDSPDIECLQAQLVIENGRRSWLAALFAGEYAGLFSVLLPGLARWRMPMPLGGTSNHFRIETLRRIGGWDAFNVTEDADIGVRLARLRLRVETLSSRTHEAAPVRISLWLGQRTRWMKGWMQTFIVHNRNPRQLAREMGLSAMLTFEVLVLGMIVAPFLHIGFLGVMLAEFLLGLPPWAEGLGWSALYGGFLALGYGSAIGMTLVGLRRIGHLHLLGVQFLLPAYWLLMTLATLLALVELVRQPFFWFKSPHIPAEPGDPAKPQARPRWAWPRKRVYAGD